MRIIKRLTIEDFWKSHPDAEGPLRDWYAKAKRSNWANFPDVKRTFGQTDQCRVASGNIVYVFDIGGNKHRLIARVSHNKAKVYVLRVMTHKEYDRERWKKEL